MWVLCRIRQSTHMHLLQWELHAVFLFGARVAAFVLETHGYPVVPERPQFLASA
jgi:hypothetical protein